MPAGFGELLTSEIGTDSEWHARYPSATVTLCGRDSVGIRKGRKYAPTCGSCSKAARMHERVCASMPDHWAAA